MIVCKPDEPSGNELAALESWMAPLPSVARTVSVYSSRPGCHEACQRRHANCEIGGSRSADCHVVPALLVHSTLEMPRKPAKATPASMIVGPLTVAPGTSMRDDVFTM